MPYRFKRRAFLGTLGGAVGLKVLLQNLEASALGATSPPRFLMMHFPCGTARYHFVPASTAPGDHVSSRILAPFQVLSHKAITLYGMRHNMTGTGGGHEDGTPFATTGANSPGTRENMGETDDGMAGGPSFDQIFLRRVPELQRPGLGYVNAICDARVDSYETSTQCLSYAYETQETLSARPGGRVAEHIPLMPELSPSMLFAKVFGTLMPGGDTEAALRALRLKKSVLDSALGELATVRELTPSSEWPKIDAHTDAIRRVETQLQDGLEGMDCMLPAAPDASLIGQSGLQNSSYNNPQTDVDDSPMLERIGKAHLGVIRAAFQCDLIRVATFQWCPGTNHVSFGGLHPTDPDAIYMHHPVTHRVGSSAFWSGSPPTADSNYWVYEFFVNGQTWFSQKTADVLLEFATTADAYGGNLLDHTIVPYITEIGDPSNTRQGLAALIFGGEALGMQAGQFQQVTGSHNNLWMTIAQAYLKTTDPLSVLADEVFVKTDVAPIPGLWSPPV